MQTMEMNYKKPHALVLNYKSQFVFIEGSLPENA